MEKFLESVANLFKVKSIITIVLTVTFAILAFKDRMDMKDFYSIMVMVLGFYFTAQNAKQDTSNK